MPSDTTEKAFESLIVKGLCTEGGYVHGDRDDYDRDHAIDLPKLLEFLKTTQPKIFTKLGLETDGPLRKKFLARLQGVSISTVNARYRYGMDKLRALLNGDADHER